MNNQSTHLPFSKINYQLMIFGIVVIGLGYLGIALDPAPYGFGMWGITIGPITILAGFCIQFFAILYIPKKLLRPDKEVF